MKPQRMIPTAALSLPALLMLLAALAAAPLSLTGCGGKEADPKQVSADSAAVVRVVTAVVQPRPFEDWGRYSAELRGADDVLLTAPLPGGGRVNRVAEVGAEVKKGQALCDIETDLYHAQLKQAQAALDLAQGEIERARGNVKEGFVGKAVLDKAELDYQGARVALIQAQRAHEAGRCEAPFAGVLVSRFVERYQNAAPGSPTVRVAGLSRLEALVSIPESESFGYREGQRAEFQLLQAGSAPVAGKIGSLDRAVEARNRVVTARVELQNPGGALKPGMIGRVDILRRRHEKALVVASQAVLRLQDGTAVMVVRDGVAHKVPVVLGPSRGDSVVVESGLSAGNRIITVGAFQVSEGTRVEF